MTNRITGAQFAGLALLLTLAACAPPPPREAEAEPPSLPTGVTIGGSTSAFYGHVR